MITPEALAAVGTEDAHQLAFFCWAALSAKQYPQLEWMHAIPNGGYRDKRTAGKLVATGVRAGIWDIYLPYPIRQPWNNNGPDGSYHGLYVEMKRADRRTKKNGGLTDEQLAFKEYVESAGYRAVVCYSWIEARDAVIAYLEGK